jgi:hypothetical protein
LHKPKQACPLHTYIHRKPEQDIKPAPRKNKALSAARFGTVQHSSPAELHRLFSIEGFVALYIQLFRTLIRQLVDAENSKPEYNSQALIILRVMFFIYQGRGTVSLWQPL